MTFEATIAYSNGREVIIELEEYQVEDFLASVIKKLVYKDRKTGVMCWLPPEHLHQIVIKPNLESHKCQENQNSDLEKDLQH